MLRLTARAGSAAAVLAALVLSPGAHADEGLNIDHVESANGQVSLLVAADGVEAESLDPGAMTVTVNGEPVEFSAETVSSEVKRTTILALDASNSMKGTPFAAAKSAALAFLEAAPEDIEVGLVTFAGSVDVVLAPTGDREALSAAIQGLELSLGTHLYDGIRDSVELADVDGYGSVLVLSDGRDQGSEATLEEAAASATDTGVVVDVVALNQAEKDRVLLEQVADTSGGQVIDASSEDAIAEAFEDQAAALAHQILVTFPQPADAGSDTTIDVSLTLGGTTVSDSTLASLEPPPDSTLTEVEPAPEGLGTTGLLAGGLALGLGLALVLGALMLGDRGPSRAERQISQYLGSADPSAAGSRAAKSDTGPQASLKDSALAISEKMVSGGLEARIEHHLVGSGLALTPAEWLLIHAGIAIASAFFGLILGGAPLLIVGLVLGGVLPWLYLRRKHAKRLAAFNSQLAETLDLIAGGLAAGLSMPQAIDTVVREGIEPVAGELRRALIEQRLGISIEDGLEGVADRMASQDFSWVVMAMRIQREVGGNLAELMRTVADTLREREYLRRQVRVLSAEGRFSGWILGALPIFMFVYMLIVRREYVSVLYTTGIGLFLLGAAGVLLAAGFFVMSRLVKIEV